MKKVEIDKYREDIDLQLKEKVTDIESNISLIIIGSLGFFLTINEKFIGLKESTQKWALLFSITLLLISFLLFLINKHLTTKYDREIIEFLDEEMKEDDKVSNTKLLRMWSKYDKTLSKNRNIIYWTVGLGILFEIFFFMFNLLNSNSKKYESENVKIEIIIKDSSRNKIKINTDTLTIKSK